MVAFPCMMACVCQMQIDPVDDHKTQISASRNAWTTEDSWYTGLPPEELSFWTWSELDRSRIHAIIESRQPQADEILRDISITEMTTTVPRGLSFKIKERLSPNE
jgi:hypothetical protein